MSASPSVALAGATGSLGSAVLKELLAARVSVTILSRKGSKSAAKLLANPNHIVKEVDYSVEEDVTAALAGIDVVVSTLATESISTQSTLINAAIAARVKRFIPSEFGCDTANLRARRMPVYAQKVQIQDTLVEKARQNTTFSYTFMFNGAFLDWGIQVGFLMNAKHHTATLYDGGNEPFSATRLSTVGKAVVGILKNLEVTKNRGVYFHDAVVTQNDLIAIARKMDPQEWMTTFASTAQIEAAGYEELGKEVPDISTAMLGFIARAVWGEGYGGDFTGRVDNELLGLPVLTKTEVEEAVKSALAAVPAENSVQL
ncbi:hypothetical protein FE257_006681 [Aspergillus nanangensis]|uniref:NmrA-like domain-containing protein n=1 Tax=Aspergillus nanangensis TaxID=2582783 RepID=A0AAD4CNZ6_ASPNN|nr:hypothetical protein FE257_006681 [Aspergillus nanangensis]